MCLCTAGECALYCGCMCSDLSLIADRTEEDNDDDDEKLAHHDHTPPVEAVSSTHLTPPTEREVVILVGYLTRKQKNEKLGRKEEVFASLPV